MTDGDRNNSGELSSFLHLTGWRPLVLALIAGLAGAYGLFGALNQPAEWQARYVLNANRVADDDLLPQELDIFVEEIAQTAKFPQVIAAVEERTGLVEEEDYEITVNQSGSSVQLIDLGVVSEIPEDAQRVAIETGIEALTITLEKILGGHEAARDRIQANIDEKDVEVVELTSQAGNITPTFAYERAVQNLLDRRAFLANPPTETVFDEDGNPSVRQVPEPEPPLADLEAEVARLEPVEREYRQVQIELDALNVQLQARDGDVRDALSALSLVETERESPLIISEVVTEETSKIAKLLTGLLLFAVPAALLTILLFVIWDLLRPKPAAESLYPAEPFDAAGVLETSGQRALPEAASVRPLVVVDEEEKKYENFESDVLSESAATTATDGQLDQPNAEPPTPGAKKPDAKKSKKDGRWGRDAGSKAG